ncbi:hypothetical protein HAX54_024736 [Datura stramonium]|uniref:Uncharacterized protein n=1 Tax=Datura stramonium TaxID=4076 RepID=A0ABS8RK14_DATST|nr:hypothetical protein [Datura stramonium]
MILQTIRGVTNSWPHHDESVPLEMYDKVLRYLNNPYVEKHNATSLTSCSPNEAEKATNVGRPRGARKLDNIIKKEMVYLRGLLAQCAQAMASYDSRTANKLLIRIREHSSPPGNGMERLAHYLANALEVRLSSIGTALYTAFASSRISAAQILKAYKAFIIACHSGLSMRPGRPPELHIIGIDLPQPGFKPTERVEDTKDLTKLFEEEVFAKDAMNVIVCKGTERVERPEMYMQWQLRCVRDGFKQLPLDQEIVKAFSNKVRSKYHKDLSVDEDGHWMLQGWKGCII